MTAPNESMCVCGHAESEHAGCMTHWGQCLASDCDCKLCRPVLPWPNEPGFWWCKGQRGSVVKAVDIHGRILIMGYGKDSWAREFGEQQFTRLLEPSPFTSTEDA